MRGPRFLIFALAAFAAAPGLLMRAAEEPALRLVDAFPGATFQRPVAAAQPPDGTERMFVAEQGGRIWIVDHPLSTGEAPRKRLFADLSERVSRQANEEGLLSFAFHPDFAANRRVIVHYSGSYSQSSQRRNVLAEIRASAADPDVADDESPRVLLEVPQPYSNHNGGWVGFDDAGLLYVALGDGGSGGDPEGNGQRLDTHLGKILRIDVDPDDPEAAYAVPPDNPFVGRAGARGAIWAYGLRNPWRCSFDRETGALWAGDVGQDRFEEIDRIERGGNYGWNRKEGNEDYAPSGTRPADPLVPPVATYGHAVGQSVTGGVVYRGSGLPSLVGTYLYGDFASGRIFALEDPYGAAMPRTLLDTSEQIASFAEDRAGEVYVLSFRGSVLALAGEEAPVVVPGPLPTTLSALGLFDDLRALRPRDGALRYDVRVPLWADGAGKDRFLVLPDGGALAWDDDEAFDLPAGGFAVKTFSLGGVRLETRVITRTETGFAAATYRWRGDLSDADRVDAQATVTVADGKWTYPSPDDCRTCHTDEAGFLLGVRAPQLRAGTIARWTRRGALTGTPDPAFVERFAPRRGGGSVEARARSYLDANCSSCHRPDASVNAGIDLRAATPLASTGMLDLPPQHGDLGLPDARILAPGDPPRSVLLARMTTLGDQRMPQLGTRVVDRRAARLVGRWIRTVRAPE